MFHSEYSEDTSYHCASSNSSVNHPCVLWITMVYGFNSQDRYLRPQINCHGTVF